jgi:hypothetical protein
VDGERVVGPWKARVAGAVEVVAEVAEHVLEGVVRDLGVVFGGCQRVGVGLGMWFVMGGRWARGHSRKGMRERPE